MRIDETRNGFFLLSFHVPNFSVSSLATAEQPRKKLISQDSGLSLRQSPKTLADTCWDHGPMSSSPAALGAVLAPHCGNDGHCGFGPPWDIAVALLSLMDERRRGAAKSQGQAPVWHRTPCQDLKNSSVWVDQFHQREQASSRD